ncbi:MAG: cell wall-binding repeat-containing protein [Egibacteraceae bacterium]
MIAHPLEHSDGPRLLNPRPAPGEVVRPDAGESGQVEISALAATDSAVESFTVALDGERVRASAQEGDHPTISGLAEVEAGEHTATVTVTDTEGLQTERSWSFTVGAFKIRRLAGEDSVETAAAISRDLYRTRKASSAVLSRVDEFADALAGVPLASRVDGPLLLTDQRALSYAASQELIRVLDEGSVVYLLGGTSALGPDVEADVKALGFVPERIQGQNRFSTATAIAQQLPGSGSVAVVPGESFVEALAMSSPAGREGIPILLTRSDGLPEETKALLSARSPRRIYVVGDQSAVSDEVLAELGTMAPEVERLAGSSSGETAAAVARRFWRSAKTIGLASGEEFAEGLAGARHAAAYHLPVLLGSQAGLPDATLTAADSLGTSQAVVYGGAAAISDSALGDLERFLTEKGPVVTDITPAAGALAPALDQIVISFDRDIVLESSTVYVTVDGQEVAGTLGTSDFPNTLVFQATELPPESERQPRYPVRVVVAASDGTEVRHLDYLFELSSAEVAHGDTGEAVTDLQQRLTDAGYWLGPVNGEFGLLTQQALTAFQKVNGLHLSGVYGVQDRKVLESKPGRPAPRSTRGFIVEVDKPKQIVMLVRDGKVEWIINTSTGTNQEYEYEGKTYLADTPDGTWKITRQVDGIRETYLGRLYRPKYFHPDGIAIHGANFIPPYPDSHGCVRVTDAAMDFLWEGNRVPIGTPVLIY